MDSTCIWAIISPVLLSMVSCLFPTVREAAQAAAKKATEECCSSAGSWLVGLCHLRTNADTLKREMDELKGIKTRLLEDVERLEKAGDVKRTPVVHSWLKEVDDLDAAVTEFESSYCCCCCPCPSPQRFCGCLCSTCELDDMLRLVREVKKRKDELGELVCPLDPPAVVEIPGASHDSNTILASRVDEILNVHLSSDEVEMVGIYGMGGVGKTELLRAVNNRLYRRSTDVHGTLPFEMVIYAKMNNRQNEGVRSSTPTVQEQIRRRLRLPASGDLSISLSSKRCLLLLDDVWDTLNWDEVGIPRPSPMMKVVFTTPSKLVCDRMKAVNIRVEFLGDEESWQLFCRKMGEVDRRSWNQCDSYVKDLARRVVSRCGGLPRAIVAIPWAVGMNFEGHQQWKRIENRLKDSPHELEGMMDVLSPLKCCLDRLEKSPTQMEECLLYCSLFPESRNINREQLIDYWFGEGFLDAKGPLSIQKIRQRGSDVIERLQKDCLLETGHRRDEDEVKLHGVVRQLALWLTHGDAKRFFTSARMEMPDISTNEGWEKAIRISLMGSSDKELPDEIPGCPGLETLLLNNHDQIDPHNKNSSRCRIYGSLDDLFCRFSKQLRVLDLSGTNIAHLPPTVGSLVGLTYLNISHTDITSLPVELRALVDLRQLNLSNTSQLKRIPYEAISQLTRLQALNLYCSCYEMSHTRRYLDVSDGRNSQQERQVGLEDLARFKLEELGISIKTKPALDGFLGASRASLRYTTFLSLDEVSGLKEDDVKSVFHSMPNLRRLSISSCPALNQLTFPIGVLQELKVLSLRDLLLSSIATEPAGSVGHFLPCLHDLQISLCHALSDLTCIKRFPHLVEISVTSCHGLKELIATPTTSDGGTTLPMLRRISLEDLTSFASFSGHPLYLTCVERIRVSGCSMLNKLPLRSSNLEALKEIEGERTWWNELEWDQGELDVLDDFRRRFKDLPTSGAASG